MAISTMLMSFAALSIITIEWSLLTYSLAFGKHPNPDVDALIGGTVFGAFDSPNALRAGFTIPEHAFMVFQLGFAAVTSAVISGGVCGRITYPAWCLFIAIWHILVYVPLAHWIFYPGGWLAKRGVLDFAVSIWRPMGTSVTESGGLEDSPCRATPHHTFPHPLLLTPPPHSHPRAAWWWRPTVACLPLYWQGGCPTPPGCATPLPPPPPPLPWRRAWLGGRGPLQSCASPTMSPLFCWVQG
jgi:hypothetical protein